MVEREREAHERFAGEDHEADAAGTTRRDEAAHLGHGGVEAAGPQVAGRHALRDVEHEDHAERLLLERRLVGPELRPRGGQREQDQHDDEQRRTPAAAAPRSAQQRAAAAAADGQQVQPAATPEQPEQGQCKRHGGQSGEAGGRAERHHGIRRQGPTRAPTSSMIRPSAASSSQGASSRERSSVSSPTRRRSSSAISS